VSHMCEVRQPEENEIVARTVNRRDRRPVLFILILVILFGASVAVRLPYVGRPLGAGHEWLTATVTRNLEVWHQEGALHDRFLPIMSYPGRANKNIDNQTSHIKDREGNFYYVSFPAFAYVLPYVVLTASGAAPTLLALQVFNLILHGVVALLLYLLVRRVLPAPSAVPALAAATIYLFTPVTLTYHSNVYMSDILAQTLFICSIWAALLWFDERRKRWVAVALPIALFCFVLTEWLSLFFGLAIVGYVLAVKRRRLATLVTVVASVALALGAIIWQYSQIAGSGTLLRTTIRMYNIRSGAGGEVSIQAAR